MLFEDRFQVPPPPGQDREAPETYPSGREHLGMAISGVGMLAAARMGLRSFGDDGDLFGVFGEKASDPMQAVLDFVREGRRIMNESDAGASSDAQAVLTTHAGSSGASKLDDTVEQIAASRSARRERIRSLSQTITRQKVRSAIDRSFSRQSDPTDAEYRAARLVQEGTDDFSGVMTPNIQGRRRVLFGQSRPERRGRRLDELGEVMMTDPQRTGRGGPAEEVFQWMGDDPGEALKDAQRALLSQMSVDAPHGIPDDVLQAAWRQWKQSHPFETKPMENPSAEEIADFAMKSDEMLQEVERRVKRRNRPQMQSPGDLGDLTGDVAGADTGVGYADPVRQGAFDDIDIDEIASYGDLEASTVMSTDGVTEELADRVRDRFSWMEERFSGEIDFSLERVDVDDYHEVFRGTIQVGEDVEEFDIPMPSEYGTYRMPGQDRSFVSPAIRLPESDFFAGRDAVEMIEETRGARVARPDELTLLSVSNFVTKMLNDLEGGRGPAAVEEFANRLRKEHFNKKSLVNDSVPDVLTKGLQVRTFTQDFFESVKGSARKRGHVEQGIESADRLRNIFQRGDRYFASDTEFVSPDVMAERGSGDGAQTAYELSGQIMDPGQKSPVAEISYHPNLFENKPEGTSAKQYRQKIKEGIKDFQSSHTSKGQEDINDLLSRLETGSLEVTVGDDTYDLLDPSQEVPDFLPSKDKSETLDRYYTRVQNRLLDEFGADFSVGQNYMSSEHAIYKQLYEQTGVNMPKVLQESNVVDMMNIAHATGAIPTGSRSLGSIVGQLHGIDQTEVRDVVSQANDKFSQFGKSVTEDILEPEQAQRLFRDSMRDSLEEMGASEGQREFWDSMRETMFQGEGSVFRNPNSFDLHTAAFDAYMTGAFGARKMNEFLESTEGTIALDRARDVLRGQDEIAGDRNFVERHSGLRYDAPGEEDEKGVDPFLVNQEAATMGAGSMVHSGVLPFARLQNPVRQLYQRNKPRRLISEPQQLDPIAKEGVPSFRRPRKPSKHMQRALRHDSKMKLFRPGEGPVEYEGPGIFAGFGTSTPQERQLRGGRANEMQFGVTTRAAMVPRNTLQTWESQAQGTAARREALMGAFDVKTDTVSIDPNQIQEGMEDWVQTKAGELDVNLYEEAESPEASRQRTANKDLLEEIYMLRRVREDRKSGASDEMMQLIRRAIESRQQAIREGAPPEKSEKIREALSEIQRAQHEDVRAPVLGERRNLFDPSGKQGIVVNPMFGPGNDNVIGIDVGVSIEETTGELKVDYIEDPGTVIKTNTAGAKTSTAAPVPGSSVGAFGEQVVMGAPFEKMKRKDFSGFIRAQVERIHRQVNDELQYLAQKGVHEGMTGNEPFKQGREEVVERAAESLSKLTKEMSKEDIKKSVIRDDLYADYVEFDYTDEFVREVEDATNMDIMNAAEEAGLTMQSSLQMADNMGVRQRSARVMRDQVDSLIEELNSVLDEGLTPTEDLDIDTQLSTEQRKQQIKNTVRQLEEQRGALDELYEGNLNDLSDNRLSSGSLYDFFITEDPQTNGKQVMAGYQVLAPEERTASPVTGGSQLGEDFEQGVGRATNRKRSSLLSTALMGHAAQQTPGGMGGPAGDIFQAWMGAKSGAAAFSDQKFRREVARELQQRGISAEDYDESNFEWDAQAQQLIFIHPDSGNRIALEANPFATMTQTQRARVGAVSMIKGEMSTETVAGQTIGGDDRVMSLSFGEDDLGKTQITPEEMHQMYGKEKRARQHYQFAKGKDPGDLDIETSTFDEPYVYFGEGARPGESPIFSEQYDFVEVNLHGNLADEELRSVAEKMEQAGISKDKIGRTLAGGEHFIESALTHGIEDPEEADRVRDLVQYIRSGEDKGFGGNMLMRTLTGEDRPNVDELGGGVQRASIGRFQDLLESTEAIATVQESIRRIREKAKDMDPDDPADQRSLRSIVQQEIEQKMGAFQEVEQLYAHTLKESVNHVTQQMEEMSGRLMGGEYSIAEPQTQILPNIQRLTETAQFGEGDGPGEAFTEEVRNLARKNQPRAAGTEKFNEAVDRAAKDIYDYLEGQHRNYGTQYHKYQGFGVGEGFLARSKAQRIAEQMRVSHKNTDFGALQDDLEPVAEGTNLQGQAQERVQNLEEKSELEVRLAQQEVQQPGSTPGILTINARQPDFTMLAGYETGRMSVMGDEAMQFMGMAPDQVHMMSNPLTTWSRREDFDFDLNYMAAISDSSVSAMMRETRAKGMPEQIALLHQVVEGAGGGLRGSGESQLSREGPVASYDTHQTEYNDIQGAGDEPITAQRVTTPFYSGDEGFDEPVAGMFGFSGQAREAVSSQEEARRAYALQQSIVGQFGAYSKQGAVQTMQRETAFMDAMTQMIETAERNEGAHQSFSNMFKAPRDKAEQLESVAGRKQMGDAWEFMKQTMKDAEAARSGALGDTGVFDPLHTAALAESEIAQGVAIEKYKSGDPQRQARRMNDILKTLHGKHRGSFSGFDEAMDALLDEEFGGMQVQDFFKRPDEVTDETIPEAQLNKTARQRARRAFRLQYNMNTSMQMLADQGISSDYLSDFANVAQSQIPTSQKLEQAVGGGAQTLQTDLPQAVAGALGPDTRQNVDRFFASQSQRESLLESTIGRPSTYEEQARRMLDDMPASVKGMGVAAAAATAVFAGMDGPDSRADGETFDLPRDRYEEPVFERGGDNYTDWSLQSYQSSRRELDFQMRERASAGRTYRARRPPTIEADY